MPAPEGNRNRAQLDQDRLTVFRVRCTDDELRIVKAAAAQRGETMSDMIRDLLREKRILPAAP